MWKKEGFYYADWTDAKGQRHRKSFAKRKDAVKFEAKQKAAASPNAKKPRRSATSRRSGKRPTPPTATAASAGK
jgi:hypothetical protein